MILTILEVSQKQAYIFSSNKLKDNIANSDTIAEVLGEEYLERNLKGCTTYTTEKNMVYSGGGHTVLQFETLEEARTCTAIITEKIYRDYNGLTVFAKSMEYDENLAPKADGSDKEDPVPGRNMKKLIQLLEEKKSIRSAVFRHGTFGIEKMSGDEANGIKEDAAAYFAAQKKEKKYYPEDFEPVREFHKLGGSKNESNFVAVVHIDGNGMGTRVADIYRNPANTTWEDLKKDMKTFSQQVDDDFKAAFKEMTELVGDNLRSSKELRDALNLKDNNFPVRRIITAGDDICFVTEGRIGIECAAAFMEALSRKPENSDNKYASCAGVAIVHQKYPFYKAYELAERLCSNAKKFNATIHKEDNGKSISSIDWHIEFGEIGDTLEDIRKTYQAADGSRLELRPYIVTADQSILDAYPMHAYENFRRLILNIKHKEDMFANGKMKEMRGALKEGETSTKYYLTFNQMEDILYEGKDSKKIDISQAFSGNSVEHSAFVKDYDDRKHSIVFDAIELLDTFLELKKEDK